MSLGSVARLALTHEGGSYMFEARASAPAESNPGKSFAQTIFSVATYKHSCRSCRRQ